MSHDKHEPSGHNIIRRLQTAEPFRACWPETITVASTMTEEGWYGYTMLMMLFIKQCADRALNMLEHDVKPGSVPVSDWNVGLYLSTYQKSNGLPSTPGIGADIVDFCLDETCVTDGKLSVGVVSVAYAPTAEDKLPGGTRLPMTDIEKATHEVGRLELWMHGDERGLDLKVTGTFAEDAEVMGLVSKLAKIQDS